MTPIRVLEHDYLESLAARKAIRASLDEYRTAETFALADAKVLPTRIKTFGDFPDLVVGKDPPKDDTENAIAVHRFLPGLQPWDAADRRLWAWFCHGPYFEYSKARWEIPSNDDRAVEHVRTHWFVDGAGLNALRRNAIARLWWAAHLTHAPWMREGLDSVRKRDDEYFFTRILLKNQDIYQGLVERLFGSDTKVLIAALQVIAEDEKKRATSDFSPAFGKEVNLQAAFTQWGSLKYNDLVARMRDVASSVEAALDRAARDRKKAGAARAEARGREKARRKRGRGAKHRRPHAA